MPWGSCLWLLPVKQLPISHLSSEFPLIPLFCYCLRLVSGCNRLFAASRESFWLISHNALGDCKQLPGERIPYYFSLLLSLLYLRLVSRFGRRAGSLINSHKLTSDHILYQLSSLFKGWRVELVDKSFVPGAVRCLFVSQGGFILYSELEAMIIILGLSSKL